MECVGVNGKSKALKNCSEVLYNNNDNDGMCDALAVLLCTSENSTLYPDSNIGFKKSALGN
jgi:hypothetical protein